VYLDRLERRIAPISDHNFNLAVRRYCSRSKKLIDDEIAEMIFDGTISRNNKNSTETHIKAIERITTKFRKLYLKK